MFNKDIIKNYCIHCNTEEKAKQLLEWAHEEGYSWNNGGSFITNHLYHNHGSNTYYNIPKGTFGGISSSGKDKPIKTFEEALLPTTIVLPSITSSILTVWKDGYTHKIPITLNIRIAYTDKYIKIRDIDAEITFTVDFNQELLDELLAVQASYLSTTKPLC